MNEILLVPLICFVFLITIIICCIFNKYKRNKVNKQSLDIVELNNLCKVNQKEIKNQINIPVTNLQVISQTIMNTSSVINPPDIYRSPRIIEFLNKHYKLTSVSKKVSKNRQLTRTVSNTQETLTDLNCKNNPNRLNTNDSQISQFKLENKRNL